MIDVPPPAILAIGRKLGNDFVPPSVHFLLVRRSNLGPYERLVFSGDVQHFFNHDVRMFFRVFFCEGLCDISSKHVWVSENQYHLDVVCLDFREEVIISLLQTPIKRDAVPIQHCQNMKNAGAVPQDRKPALKDTDGSYQIQCTWSCILLHFFLLSKKDWTTLKGRSYWIQSPSNRERCTHQSHVHIRYHVGLMRLHDSSVPFVLSAYVIVWNDAGT